MTPISIAAPLSCLRRWRTLFIPAVTAFILFGPMIGAAAIRITPSGVTFSFHSPSAHKVYLAGDFNNWGNNRQGKVSDPDFEMRRDDTGVWRKSVKIESAEFRYKFVVADPQGNCSWFSDPDVYERDGDGNSVVRPAETASPDKVTIVETDFAKWILFHEDGRSIFLVRDTAGRTTESVKLLPLSFDGRIQKGYQYPKGKGPVDLATADVRFAFEVLGPRAIAATWTAKDNLVHDVELRVDDNSSVFGGGERFHSLNQKGYALRMVSVDNPDIKGTSTYKPVPFYMSARGYGFWLDSFFPGLFDFNASNRYHMIIRYPEKRFRAVMFAGPKFTDILESFTGLTGRPPVPPEWAFAPWKSRDVHRNREDVLEDIEKSRRYDLPASVLVLDSPWETGYNNFILNQTQFTEARKMFNRIRELGFVTCLWLTPFVNSKNVVDMNGISPGSSSNFQEAVAGGHLVRLKDGSPMISRWWKGEGGLVDFTRPASVDWWHKQIDQAAEWGARGFKCDDGEGDFIQDAVFHDGSTSAEMKNRYALLYLKTMHEYIQKRLGGDGVLLARPGFTGSQSYPFCWSGDNYAEFSFTNGLPTVITAAQTAAMSGFSFWGHDIAGYIGKQTKELFSRWTQFGAFSPLMQVHMQSNMGPWDYGDTILAVYRKYAKLHTSLFPYIYDAAHESAKTGLPIVRPMPLAFQEDREAWLNPYQYMFGPEFLVAPVYTSGTRRAVYLPPGKWIDYWTGAEFEGPRTIEAIAPRDVIPVYVRAGAVIPMIPSDVDSLIRADTAVSKDVVTLDARRILQVWPGSPRAMDTWDTLWVAPVTRAGRDRLVVSSAERRPLDVRFPFQILSKVVSDGIPYDSISYDTVAGRTTVSWREFRGKTELWWEK